MAKASGSIDLRPMKDASKVADNFLKFEPNKGLMIADQTNGIQAIDTTTQRNVLIDADSVDVRDGQNVLASFGTSTIVGKPNAENVSISSSGIEIHNTYLPYSDSGTYLGVYGPVASFTADSHRLGGPKQGHLTVTNKGLSVFSGDESSKYNEVANFFTRQKKFEYDNYEDEFQFDWKTGTKLNIRFETTKDANTIIDPVISCCVEWEEDGDIISTGFTEFSAVLSSLTVDGSTYNFSVAKSSVGNEAIVSITSLQNLSLGNDAKFLVKIKYTAKVKGPHYGLGYLVQPIGTFSTALGQGTISLGDYQLALGNYNKPNKDALFVIGNGTSDNDRSNAFTIDQNGNILIDSNSIDIRSEETQAVLTTIDDNGLMVNDGTGVTVAKFLNTGAQIGKDGKSHLEMDYRSMQLIDKEGDTYFFVSDLREANGNIINAFVGDGQKSRFILSAEAEDPPSSSNTAVTVDGVPQTWGIGSALPYVVSNFSDITLGNYSLLELLGEAPANGAEIVIEYAPRYKPYALTLGSRSQGYSIGEGSVVCGKDCSATSVNAFAQGRGTIASRNEQFVFGRYNDVDDTYAAIIGNGRSDTNRSNAFAVDWDGNVMAQGMAGMIQMFGGTVTQTVTNGVATTTGAPAGWLLCDGSVLNKSAYPELAAVLGSTYGGNGTTTFAVPDMRGRFPLGVSTSHPLKGTGSTGGSENATLVSHSHGPGSLAMDEKGGHAHKIRLNDVGASGSARNIPVSSAALSNNTFTDTVGSHKHTISGSTETKGSSATGANMPPYRTVNFIIATGKTS